MSCRSYKDLMMGYVDNELKAEEKRRFEEHIAACSECAAELQEFKKLKQITEGVTLAEPEDRLWQQYWQGAYNRMERGIGWILLGVSGIALIIYGGFKIIEELVKDPSVGIILKVALIALLASLAVLFVSVLRERLFFWRHDRYRDVRR
ncbi:anti-sigma factor family protein [Planctomycetota bacterium]